MPIEMMFYVIDCLDSLKDVVFFFTFISFIFIIVLLFRLIQLKSSFDEETQNIRKTSKLLKKIITIYVISILLYILTPCQKTLYLMMGANYLKKTNLPTKVELVINKKLDEYLVMDAKK